MLQLWRQAQAAMTIDKGAESKQNISKESTSSRALSTATALQTKKFDDKKSTVNASHLLLLALRGPC
jgi:hypothetical protein